MKNSPQYWIGARTERKNYRKKHKNKLRSETNMEAK
jgi:hypothetical protein